MHIKFLQTSVLVASFFMVTYVEGVETVNVDFTAKMFSGLSDGEKRIIEDYAGVFPKFQHFYSNMKMSVCHRVFQYLEEFSPTAKSLDTPLLMLDVERDVKYRVSAGSGVYSFDGNLHSLVKSRLLADAQLEDADQMSPTEIVTLVTPSQVYGFTKHSPERQYPALNFRRKYDAYMKDDGISLLYFDTAPFAETGTTLDELLLRLPPFPPQSRDNYVIDSVRQIEEDGQMYVEFRSHIIGTNAKWIITLSQQTWAVIKTYYENEIPTVGKCWKTTHCYYEGKDGDIPLLKSYQVDFGYFDENEKMRLAQRDVYDVTSLVPGPPDLSEFDVAQFLPPNVKIRELSWGPLSPARIAGMVIGTLLFMIGIYLKIRSMRKEQITNP